MKWINGRTESEHISFICDQTCVLCSNCIFIPLIWEGSWILSHKEDLSSSDSHQWTARQKDKEGRIWKSFKTISSENLTALIEMKLRMEWNKFAFQSTNAVPPTMFSLIILVPNIQNNINMISAGESWKNSERSEKISHLSANHNIPLVLSHQANKSKYN